MISATIEKLIDQVVLDRIGSPVGQTFSAYDITRDVRKLTTEIFYHGDAKDYIHAKLQDSQMFDLSDSGFGYRLYTRNSTVTQCIPAVVNNPSFTTNYPGLPKNPPGSHKVPGMVTGTFSRFPPNKAASQVIKAGGAVTTRKPDARGTVSIPNNMVKAIGLKPKDRVVATKSGNRLIIRKEHTSLLGTDVYIYTVDHSRNIRVTKAALKDAGIKTNNPVTVTMSKDLIVVE